MLKFNGLASKIGLDFSYNPHDQAHDQTVAANTSLPHQLTANVKLLHKVAVISQNKVLILKRSANAFSRPSKWDLPGGNSEWPQNAAQPKINLHQQDIAREIREETGLSLSPQLFEEEKLIYFATYFEPEPQIYSINCGWTVQIESQLALTVNLSKEHTKFIWIAKDEVPQYDFGGSDRDFETKIIRRALN